MTDQCENLLDRPLLQGVPASAVLTHQDSAGYRAAMPTIKISSKVEEEVWNDLRRLADESHQNISDHS